jgi:predicted  nucleic acid-binding Zn-ribbon protein
MKGRARPITARQLTPLKRRLHTLERSRVALRNDVAKLQIEVYDLTSRIDALERKARDSKGETS